MKNKKVKKFNLIINFLIIILLVFSQSEMALAFEIDGGFLDGVNQLMGIGSPPAFLDSIFSDLGVDKDELKNNIQTFNVASKKKTAPQVSLFFSPIAPEEGEKITVTASPSYFLNDPKDLYYTWFLKSKGCYECPIGECDDILESCDSNKDGRVNIEDYKVKATRIIVNGGFLTTNPNDPTDDIYESQTDDDDYEASSGGDDQKGKTAHCYVHDVDSGEEYEIDCGDWKDNSHESHLFPNAPGETTGSDDSSFGVKEEKFWHTDPKSNDTANRGNVDEANVAGLGIVDFTWNYQRGDKVGVAVEGVSTESTQAQDSSYKTMWAMSKKTYTLDAQNNSNYPNSSSSTTTATDTLTNQTTTTIVTTLEEIDEIVNEIATIKTTITTETIITDSITGAIISDTSAVSDPTYSTKNLAGEFDIEIGNNTIEKPSDLNPLLYDALVSPSENSAGSNKLDINLSYSPTNPMNDPLGIDGDTLVITSSIPNAKDNNYLQYNWKVYASNDINPNKWGDPSESPLLSKERLKNSTQSVGLGLDTFKFKLSLYDSANPSEFDYKYLRVLLTVTENIGEENGSRINSQDIIIPIISMGGDRISAYSVFIADDSSNTDNPSKVSLSLYDEICNDIQKPIEKAICPVLKNQIIGLAVPENKFSPNTTDFLWTIDGKPFSYSYCYFDDCDLEKQTNVAYFPVLKEVGEQYTINLTTSALNGKKINLTRIFKVVDPTIEILGEDNCKKTIIGEYFDTDGNSYPDESKLNFNANLGSDIKLSATTTAPSILPINYVWNVDGNTINSINASQFDCNLDDTTGILTLLSKDTQTQGDSYNVTVSALYTQSNPAKKALKNIWGVGYNQFYEKILFDDAIITMQEDPSATAIQGSSKKIFASIYSSAPTYIAFLLRIVLTISILLFTTKLIFSFSPEIKSEEDF